MMKRGNAFANLTMVVTLMLVFEGCSKHAPKETQYKGDAASNVAGQQLYQECLDTAKKAIGERAEIVKFGTFNNPQIQEAVAVVRAKVTPSTKKAGLSVQKFVILRHDASKWNVVLNASDHIQNEAGYVGIDYIDDSPNYGYSVELSNQREDGKSGFTLDISYMEKDGKPDTESLPIEISWDPTVSRYREFSVNSDPSGFKTEIKNPPHIKHW